MQKAFAGFKVLFHGANLPLRYLNTLYNVAAKKYIFVGLCMVGQTCSIVSIPEISNYFNPKRDKLVEHHS